MIDCAFKQCLVLVLKIKKKLKDFGPHKQKPKTGIMPKQDE